MIFKKVKAVLILLFAACVQIGYGQVITTIAGTGVAGYNGDGRPATTAQLSYPSGIAVDNLGNFFIAEEGNSRVRKIDGSGNISTIAGTSASGYGGDNGPATGAQLTGAGYLAITNTGEIYISDVGNSRIRKVNSAGIITTFAGKGVTGFSGDNGPATDAKLWFPQSIAFDKRGNLYIADVHNYRVRKVNTGGIITTVAGNGISGYSGDNGPATAAELGAPEGVAIDTFGNLIIADGYKCSIRRVDSFGIITTIAGNGTPGYSGDGGQATAATLTEPVNVTIDGSNNIYVSEFHGSRIRKIAANGIISTIAGNGSLGYNGDNISAISAQVNEPSGTAVDMGGSIYIADRYNHRIRYIGATVSVKEIAKPMITCTVFPNPNNGIFTVTGTLTTTPCVLHFEITNSSGNAVYQIEDRVQNLTFIKNFELKNLTPDVYTLKINAGTTSSTAKFVMQ